MSTVSVLLIRIIINVSILLLVCNAVRVVRVDKGNLAGTTYTLHNGRVVHAFLGIPYAAPPTGHNRFKPPQPVPFWYGTRNATYAQNKCLQFPHSIRNTEKVLGDEDCLYLNVFTPKLPTDSNNLMNVLVNIHGGAFMFGSGMSIRPDYIMQEADLVFVSINYRLGVLGFFATNNRIAPGNYGLKDQVAALQWVKRNIRYFGGNPKKVTIYGNSAGGASVHYHYFSRLSKGLFHNGISSSGSALTPWARPKNIAQKSIQLASHVGCPTKSTWFMIRCLRKKSAKQIVEATKNFSMWRYCPFTVFGPVVEPPSRYAFITKIPLEMLKNKQVNNVPWMVGMVKYEGLYPGADIISKDAYLRELNDQWYDIAPNLLQYNFSTPESEKHRVSTAAKHFYFGNETISRSSTDSLIQMLSDRLYYNDITYSLKLHSAALKTANVYCYNFMYNGNFTLMDYFFANNWKNYDPGHGDDEIYLINWETKFYNHTGDNAKMVELMTSSTIAFMNIGNPSTKGIKWLPIKKNDPLTCLGIHSPDIHDMENIVGNSEHNKFWKKLIPTEYSEGQYDD